MPSNHIGQSPSVKTEETLNDPDVGATKNEYEQLCRELNMDESTMDLAWKSYIAIRHNYTLEVKYEFSVGCFV